MFYSIAVILTYPLKMNHELNFRVSGDDGVLYMKLTKSDTCMVVYVESNSISKNQLY